MGAKFVVIVAAVAIILLGNNQSYKVDAKEVVVGDDRGWTIPASPHFYSSWASNHTLSLGDILVFNFVTGFHTVALVDKDSFDSCDASNPISVMSQGPAHFPIKSKAQLHFICTVGSHCQLGQKLAVKVTAAAGHRHRRHHHHHHLSQAPSPSPAPAPAPAPISAVSSSSFLSSPMHGIFATFSLALLVSCVLGFW